MTTQLMLRLPKALLSDLEETVIQQDRQFLTEVARSLGLPVPDVLRRVLGTGASQCVPVLWVPPTAASDDPLACPWWECHNGTLWRRCPRSRLSPTMPCPIHERSTPCPLTLLDNDPHIRGLPWRTPVAYNGHLYWVDPTGTDPVLTEDGRVVAEPRFRWINHRGVRTPAALPPVEI